MSATSSKIGEMFRDASTLGTWMLSLCDVLKKWECQVFN